MIRLKNIYKTYDNKEIISGLNLEIEKNKTTVIMGISGSGKTTLANILLGLREVDSGEIEGLENLEISAVFQEDRLSEQLSAISNVKLALKKDIKDNEIVKQFQEVDMDYNILNKPVSSLSGGQRRRVAVVRAIMTEADFYCLDEPFKGLDHETKIKTMRYVADNIKDKTSLIITHSVEVARFFDAKCINLNDGDCSELLQAMS
ncbi:MAG: ATP-binding cassette domain-containing protein [Clostridia bacterium]